MKSVFTVFLAAFLLFSCGKKGGFIPRNFDAIEIETLVHDSLLNVRTLELDDERLLGISSVGMQYSLFFDGLNELIETELVRNPESRFRSCAIRNDNFFYLSIGSPAELYKNGMLVYYEKHPKAFFDSMGFWNDQEGIAIGDSTDGCLSVIITRDGGETWTKLSCNELPKGSENEGAFAASDTNIAIVGNKAWVATTYGRVYYSPDKGKTWEVFDTPIVKEKDTEGIYSIDFYNELNGFAIGGDYTKPNDNTANKIATSDGGKTWQLVAQNQNPGYRSCVQYVPNGKAKELVAVGFKGVDVSNDAGESWKHLNDEGFYTIRFLNDSVA
ncbi:WD40/YVTN/BNR-like repeat-containing protein [Flavisericum labens]|uniref:WD40/YVTN/BNR-like repeat-containing protein n=1 Tax=Flavisericum labens TaxID=3377112 RepID=UPI00387B5F1B